MSEAIENNEEYARAEYNKIFSLLDDTKSAGSFYIGDNGCFMLEFLEINNAELEMLKAALLDSFESVGLSVGFVHSDKEHITLNAFIC